MNKLEKGGLVNEFSFYHVCVVASCRCWPEANRPGSVKFHQKSTYEAIFAFGKYIHVLLNIFRGQTSNISKAHVSDLSFVSNDIFIKTIKIL